MQNNVIVIGSGPGGAISALTLAEKGVKVTLLEEGTHCKYVPMFSLDDMQHHYRNKGQTALFGNPNVSYVEGCCVGGGSEVNSGLYHRTPPQILQEWNLPNVQDTHFSDIESLLSITTFTDDAPAYSFKLEEGAKQLGWASSISAKWFTFDPKTKKARRNSMGTVVIPTLEKLGVTVLDNTRARKLKRKKNHWEIICQDKTLRASHIILACGAIQTPFLLQKSGLLKKTTTLTCHPTLKVVARFKEKVNGFRYGMGPHQAKHPNGIHSFGSSVSLPHQMAILLKDHPNFWEWMDHWEHLGVFYVMIKGTSKGKINTLPFVDTPFPNYPLNLDEQTQLRLGQDLLDDLLKTAGATHTYKAPLNTVMTIHLMGSIPFGDAIDDFGQLKGHQHLLINDASFFKSAIGVNPQGTLMAFARRNALHYYQENF